MESFNYRGKSIQFWKTTGEVLGSQKHNETHISASGGGGYVSQGGGGYVAPPTIHSKITSFHEFWLKSDDGREVAVKLTDCDIPLREGQKVTLVSAGNTGENEGWYSILVNHNAGRHWFLSDAASLNKKLRFSQITISPLSGIPLILAGVALLVTYFLTKSTFLPVVICGVILGYALIKDQARIKKMQNALDRHLERLAQSAYSNP